MMVFEDPSPIAVNFVCVLWWKMPSFPRCGMLVSLPEFASAQLKVRDELGPGVDQP